ncbi:MAG: hypothetical protein AAF211_24465, partial [Myxococcota bacterium]
HAMATLTASSDLGENNSFTGQSTPGRDGVLRLELTEGQELAAHFELSQGSEILYLLTDPCDPDSVLAASDRRTDYALGDAMLTYTAQSTQTVYLVVDEPWALGNAAALDLDVR